ncbi:MAG TPA: hypothetical protein VF281_05030 [Candidatus Saccharimonadales bacterium]
MNPESNHINDTQDLNLPPLSAVPKKWSKLAVWTLVLNIIHYSMPLIFFCTWLIIVASGGIQANDPRIGIFAIFISLFFFSFVLLVGPAMLVLDILYLVQVKPRGKVKALIVTSLTLYGLMLLVSIIVNQLDSSGI